MASSRAKNEPGRGRRGERGRPSNFLRARAGATRAGCFSFSHEQREQDLHPISTRRDGPVAFTDGFELPRFQRQPVTIEQSTSSSPPLSTSSKSQLCHSLLTDSERCQSVIIFTFHGQTRLPFRSIKLRLFTPRFNLRVLKSNNNSIHSFLI